MDVPTDCLWCGAALEPPIEASNRCSVCGRGNRRDDLLAFRTRRPWARRLQGAMQLIGIALLAVAFYVGVAHARGLRGGIDPVAGRAIVLCALGGIALTYGSGFVTRRRSARLPAFFALSLVVGPLLLIPVVLVSLVLAGMLRVPLLISIGVFGGALLTGVWRRTRRRAPAPRSSAGIRSTTRDAARRSER